MNPRLTMMLRTILTADSEQQLSGPYFRVAVVNGIHESYQAPRQVAPLVQSIAPITRYAEASISKVQWRKSGSIDSHVFAQQTSFQHRLCLAMAVSNNALAQKQQERRKLGVKIH